MCTSTKNFDENLESQGCDRTYEVRAHHAKALALLADQFEKPIDEYTDYELKEICKEKVKIHIEVLLGLFKENNEGLKLLDQLTVLPNLSSQDALLLKGLLSLFVKSSESKINFFQDTHFIFFAQKLLKKEERETFEDIDIEFFLKNFNIPLKKFMSYANKIVKSEVLLSSLAELVQILRVRGTWMAFIDFIDTLPQGAESALKVIKDNYIERMNYAIDVLGDFDEDSQQRINNYAKSQYFYYYSIVSRAKKQPNQKVYFSLKPDTFCNALQGRGEHCNNQHDSSQYVTDQHFLHALAELAKVTENSTIEYDDDNKVHSVGLPLGVVFQCKALSNIDDLAYDQFLKDRNSNDNEELNVIYLFVSLWRIVLSKLLF